MALVEYYVGSHGPYFYDDAGMHPDGVTPQTALTGPKVTVTDAPVDGTDVANKDYVDAAIASAVIETLKYHFLFWSA